MKFSIFCSLYILGPAIAAPQYGSDSPSASPKGSEHYRGPYPDPYPGPYPGPPPGAEYGGERLATVKLQPCQMHIMGFVANFLFSLMIFQHSPEMDRPTQFMYTKASTLIHSMSQARHFRVITSLILKAPPTLPLLASMKNLYQH